VDSKVFTLPLWMEWSETMTTSSIFNVGPTGGYWIAVVETREKPPWDTGYIALTGSIY